MLKVLNGEIFRLLHKKSMYIYFCSLAVGYFLIAFIRSGGFNEQSILDDAMNFFNFLPALAGGYLFSAIYTDDLTAKNLITLVGFGMNKARIVLVKFILTALFGAVIYALAPLLLYVVHAVFGWTATAGTMTTVYAVSLKYLLTTLGYSVLSGIAVYGLQRTTFAMVLYILLAFNVIGGLVTVFLVNMLGANLATHITNRLLSGLTDRILTGLASGTSLTAPIIEYVIFIAIAAAVSIMAFNKKEMEF